ncbi:MAG: branched-chain amino acid ABC transporter permease [Burkholderiales bacterium]
MRDRSTLCLGVVLLALLVVGPLLPDWLRFVGTIALANSLVILGVMLLMRAGLVSFGQGLYYCIGGYAAGAAGKYWGVSDAFALLALGVVTSAVVAAILGLLLSRYREIFFAMFTMAFSMILYGLLSRTQALGSTDGFNVVQATFLGFRPPDASLKTWLFAMTVLVAVGCAIALQRYLRSGMGFAGEAIRENEIRVEYLGVSVQRVIYAKYVLAAVLAALGGGLQALATGHVGPDMAYWTTSGEFVFVVLLGGTAHVGAALLASFLFELVKTYVSHLSPYTWQLSLGLVLLAIILFLPKGLWSLLERLARRPA